MARGVPRSLPSRGETQKGQGRWPRVSPGRCPGLASLRDTFSLAAALLTGVSGRFGNRTEHGGSSPGLSILLGTTGSRFPPPRSRVRVQGPSTPRQDAPLSWGEAARRGTHLSPTCHSRDPQIPALCPRWDLAPLALGTHALPARGGPAVGSSQGGCCSSQGGSLSALSQKSKAELPGAAGRCVPGPAGATSAGLAPRRGRGAQGQSTGGPGPRGVAVGSRAPQGGRGSGEGAASSRCLQDGGRNQETAMEQGGGSPGRVPSSSSGGPTPVPVSPSPQQPVRVPSAASHLILPPPQPRWGRGRALCLSHRRRLPPACAWVPPGLTCWTGVWVSPFPPRG